LNCVGDTFQAFGVPTLLYEAGHYPNDYEREEVRRFIFIAILKALDVISKGIDSSKFEDYFEIPQNSKCFYDVIIRNAKMSRENSERFDIAILYKEVLNDGRIEFRPVIDSISNLDEFYGHKEIDAKGHLVTSLDKSELKCGYENDFVLINTKKMSLKP
jgi:hypothetical protein